MRVYIKPISAAFNSDKIYILWSNGPLMLCGLLNDKPTIICKFNDKVKAEEVLHKIALSSKLSEIDYDADMYFSFLTIKN